MEKDLLVSILNLTLKGPISKVSLSRCAEVSNRVTDEFLKRAADEELVKLIGKTVETSPSQRIRIAVKALEMGADFEKVCRSLSWQEFESITALSLERNNFMVRSRLRFHWANRRWEIDVLGCKEPTIVCVDCKHWNYGWGRTAITRTAEAQIERTKALTETLRSTQLNPNKWGLAGWKQVKLIPLIISLASSSLKFHKRTPIVPVLQLQSFLYELPAYADTLMGFSLA